MSKHVQHRPAQRLLVVMPSFVGECVLAMPTLRALRELYPSAHIAALVCDSVKGVIESCPWVSQVIAYRRGPAGSTGGAARRRRVGAMRLRNRIASMKFDTAVLLSDSFRMTLLVRMAGVKRCIGYERDGRGLLLTERLLPRRQPSGFVPVSRRDYYLGLARYLGATDPDPSLQLFTRSEDEAEAQRIIDSLSYRGQRLVLMAPGSSYGDAQRWPAERFAAVADRCQRELHAAVGVIAGPHDAAVVQQMLAAAHEPVIDLGPMGLNLGLLKSLVRRCSLLIGNDTGPRHIAAAMNVPAITIFGPTDPKWTETHHRLEQKLAVEVFCGPCQQKRCPLLDAAGRPDHRCMKLIEPQTVFEAAAGVLGATAAVGTL